MFGICQALSAGSRVPAVFQRLWPKPAIRRLWQRDSHFRPPHVTKRTGYYIRRWRADPRFRKRPRCSHGKLRITAAELGKGSAEGRMNISWEAADKMLAERPITLVFSQNPGGPWTTIAAGLENTGRYSWVIDSRVPLLIYLRLEVRDEAGNLTISESPDPVALDQLRPAAKIKDVRPVAKNQ